MDRLGYAPDLIVRRKFRNPKEISDAFREEQKQAETEKRKQLGEEHEAGERLKGMSAAKAERSGAAVSIPDALTPLSDDIVIVVSGDAGFCVEEFCRWLNGKGFFLHLPDKRKRR